VERAAILRHGPWPPPGRHASKEAVALGERLFFEPRLSGTGSVLCATCHVPYRALQDGRERAFGLEQTDLNTPTLLNVAYSVRFGWRGTNTSLAAQSVRPLLERREMRSSAEHVAATVRTLFKAQYEALFGPASRDEDVLANVGKALAAYQETLVSGRTPFDDFRDGAGSYPAAAQRGLRLFIERCDGCHAGPTFSSGKIVDGFRVPGLRNVALTAPYMHDGSVPTLERAVQHPGSLGEEQINDLAAFLRSLSDAATLP